MREQSVRSSLDNQFLRQRQVSVICLHIIYIDSNIPCCQEIQTYSRRSFCFWSFICTAIGPYPASGQTELNKYISFGNDMFGIYVWWYHILYNMNNPADKYIFVDVLCIMNNNSVQPAGNGEMVHKEKRGILHLSYILCHTTNLWWACRPNWDIIWLPGLFTCTFVILSHIVHL